MIHLHDVTKYFGSQIVFDNASCHIESGSFNYLLGTTGSGKTTFIQLINRQITADGGMIKFQDYELNSLSGKRLAYHRQRIGIVSQKPSFLHGSSVAVNIALLAEIAGKSRSEIEERTRFFSQRLGVWHFLDYPLRNLSIGQRQLVQLVRVFVLDPAVVLVDIPTQHLDVQLAGIVMDTLYENNLKSKNTTLITTPHLDKIYPNLQSFVINQHHIAKVKNT